MGYRFRKSINLGRGFKVNLSKSGIGYSWGIPGIRYSKAANGRGKLTFSIPGTGISYVKDINFGKKRQDKPKDTKVQEEIIEEKVSNTDFEASSADDELIGKINEFRTQDKFVKIVIILLSVGLVWLNPFSVVLGLVFLSLYLMYRNLAMKVSAEYDFDSENKNYCETMNNFFNAIASSQKLWLIEAKYNIDENRSVLDDSCVERIPISITQKIPYYLKTNIKCHCLSIQGKNFYFLPDKVLADIKGKTFGLNFDELSFVFDEIAFVEKTGFPSDSEKDGYTYLYVNKNGEPDKRYKNNPKYPKCLYGTIDIKKDDELNLSLLLSSKAKTAKAKQYYEALKNINISSTNKTKKCINCGADISADAKFCKHCGSKQ